MNVDPSWHQSDRRALRVVKPLHSSRRAELTDQRLRYEPPPRHPNSVIVAMVEWLKRYKAAQHGAHLPMANLGGGGQSEAKRPTNSTADYSGEWAI